MGGPLEEDRNGETDNDQDETPHELAILHKVVHASQNVEEVASVELLIKLVIDSHGDFKHSHEVGDDGFVVKAGSLAVVLGQ